MENALKILITGSEGLIGAKLATRLLAAGFSVKRFDIKLPQGHPGCGDILKIKQLQEVAKDCIGIVHLAAISRVIWGEKDPELCFATNVIGTKNVLQVAQSMAHPPWVLYASSREVYGQQQQLPVKSNAAYQPMNVYAKSKVAAEQMVLAARNNGLQTAIVRYSNVYGEVADHHDRVVPAFCRASAQGGVIRVDGAKHTFDFTHVIDSVAGTIKIIKKLQNKPSLALSPLQLTTGHPTTLYELAKLAISVGDKKTTIINAPPRSFDVTSFYGDTKQAKEILDWQTEISLQEGVTQLVQQFVEQV